MPSHSQKPENKSLWKPLFCIFEGKMKIRVQTWSLRMPCQRPLRMPTTVRRLNFKDMGEYIYVFYLYFTCIFQAKPHVPDAHRMPDSSPHI